MRHLILQAMKDKGISQRKLAEMTGIPQPHIARHLRPKNPQRPNLDTLNKLATALGLETVEWD